MNRRELLRNTGAVIALAAGSLMLPGSPEGKLVLLEEEGDAKLQSWLLQTGRSTLSADLYQYASSAIDQTGTMS